MSDRPIIGVTVGTPFNPNHNEKGTIKEGSENLWELETGVYHIKGGFHYGTPRPPIYPNFKSIVEGYAFITKDYRVENTTNYYVFADNKIYYGSIMTFKVTDVETGEETTFAEGNVNEMPTSNAVKDYVNEAIKNLGGGSNIDLVTEFKGTDVNYEERQAYNANAVNQAFIMYGEILEGIFNDLEDLKGQAVVIDELSLLVGGAK